MPKHLDKTKNALAAPWPVLGKTRFVVFIIMIAALWFIPVTIAGANAAPPPTRIWVNFYDQNDEPIPPEGFQIIECSDETCSQPKLLDAFGVCDGEGCVQTEPSRELQYPLECSGNSCITMVYYSHDLGPYIKIVGVFPGKSLASEPMKITEPSQHGNIRAWRVNLREEGLELFEDTSFQSPVDSRATFYNFPITFGITLIVETLVAGVLFFFMRLRDKPLAQTMVAVVVVNLVSYPLTWSLLPLLSQFANAEDRTTAIAIILASAIFTVLLVVIGSLEGKPKLIFSILTSIAFVVSICIVGLIFAGSSYSNYRIIVKNGLPTDLILLLSETFAVIFEGTLLYLLLRKVVAISIKQTMLASLLMNLFSYLAGLAIFLL